MSGNSLDSHRVTFPEYCNPNYDLDGRTRPIAPCSHEFIGAREAQLLQRTVAQRSLLRVPRLTMTIAYCPKRAALPYLVSAWVAFLASPGLAGAQGHHVGASGLPHNIPDFCEAATVRSVGSGAWSSPATWSAGRVPVAGEGVSIGEGTTVTYDVVSNAALACVDVHGAVRFRTDINTRLTVGTLEVLPSGSIEIGTQASPVAAGVTAELVIADRPLNTSTDPEQYGTGFIAFGRVRIHGAVKSPTFDRLTREPTAGTAALTATQTLAGWAAGDRLVIPDSRHLKWNEVDSRFSLQCEELTLGSASGAQLNLTSALRFNHPGARNGDGVLEFLPHIGNLTRNVIIRSQSPTGTRGHVIFSGRADVDVRYALFKDLGRTTVAPLDDTTFDSGGHPTHIGTNQIGRYSLHLHHLMGPSAAPSSGYQYVLIGNAIDGGTKWGIAIHNTHYGLVSDNVLYNIGGALLMAEDGSESYNVIERNFGARAFGSGGRDAGGREGIGFYFRGPNNYVRDNVAATLTHHESYGYKYFLEYLGNIRIPNFPGADTTVSGQYTVRSGHEIPVREFARNEVYGATPRGLVYWWVGSVWRTPAATEPSIFKDLRAWHVHNQVVVQYPSSQIVLDGLVVRGVLRETACCSTGYDGGDYDADRFVIRNADIQGMSDRHQYLDRQRPFQGAATH